MRNGQNQVYPVSDNIKWKGNPNRITDKGKNNRRHDPYPHQGNSHQIGKNAINRHLTEMVNRKGRGRQARHQRGQPDPDDIDKRAPRIATAASIAAERLTRKFVQRDQGKHRCKGHLKAGADQTFGIQQQDQDSGKRDHSK